MSKKEDILDAAAATSARRGLIYTCNCGWIDLGHARPDGAQGLWKNISQEIGERSRDGKGFRVTYSQTMTSWRIGVTKDFYVSLGLLHAQRESVALSIFMGVSQAFESFQHFFVFRSMTDSGFSAEDLVSDVVGFYRAVRPGVDYIGRCKPVSKEASNKVWEEQGAVGEIKNRFFTPLLFPCSECANSVMGPSSAPLPSFLNDIMPATPGVFFRDWKIVSDMEKPQVIATPRKPLY
jgi:hypothetical protein